MSTSSLSFKSNPSYKSGIWRTIWCCFLYGIDRDHQILGSSPQAIRSLEMVLDELLAEAARRPGDRQTINLHQTQTRPWDSLCHSDAFGQCEAGILGYLGYSGWSMLAPDFCHNLATQNISAYVRGSTRMVGPVHPSCADWCWCCCWYSERQQNAENHLDKMKRRQLLSSHVPPRTILLYAVLIPSTMSLSWYIHKLLYDYMISM